MKGQQLMKLFLITANFCLYPSTSCRTPWSRMSSHSRNISAHLLLLFKNVKRLFSNLRCLVARNKTDDKRCTCLTKCLIAQTCCCLIFASRKDERSSPGTFIWNRYRTNELCERSNVTCVHKQTVREASRRPSDRETVSTRYQHFTPDYR